MASVMYFLLISILISLCSSQAVNNKEVKSGHTFTLCGEAFIHMWKVVCRLKYNSVSKRKRARRSIEEMIKPRTREFLLQADALQFFGAKRQRRQVLMGGVDNANEECCKESCSYAEIAEYRC